jgi:hypothetical protein
VTENPTATCHVCRATAPLPTSASDVSWVVGEPKGWAVLILNIQGKPVASYRLCPECTVPIRTHLGV